MYFLNTSSVSWVADYFHFMGIFFPGLGKPFMLSRNNFVHELRRGSVCSHVLSPEIRKCGLHSGPAVCGYLYWAVAEPMPRSHPHLKFGNIVRICFVLCINLWANDDKKYSRFNYRLSYSFQFSTILSSQVSYFAALIWHSWQAHRWLASSSFIPFSMDILFKFQYVFQTPACPSDLGLSS